MTLEKNIYYLRSNENQFEGRNFMDQLKELKILLHNGLKSKNLNILVGSGCSLPAVPLMGNTFNQIKENHQDLILGTFDGDSNDIEGYLNWLNTGIKFLEQLDDETVDINEKLIEYRKSFETTKSELIKTIPKEYDISNEKMNITKQNYIDFYNAIFSFRGIKNYAPVNIYTTNYDLFNEMAMEQLGIHYTNGFKGHINRVFDPTVFQLRLVDDENRYKDKWSIIRNYIKLYKIHGSIDWKYKDEVVVHSQRDLQTEDVVIYPTISKHLETQQTPYSELFRALTVNLQKPDSTLIVLGYGFPDQHINQLITQSLSNEDFTLIVFGNSGEDNAADFIDKHKNKKNFHFIGGTIYQLNDGHHFSNVINYINGGNEGE